MACPISEFSLRPPPKAAYWFHSIVDSLTSSNIPEVTAGIVVIRLREQTLPMVRQVAERLGGLLATEQIHGRLCARHAIVIGHSAAS